MKFLVDSLPYYGDACPMMVNDLCIFCDSGCCPRHWDKESVCSDENPHECQWLKEIVKE